MTIINRIITLSAVAVILSACGGGKKEEERKDYKVKPVSTVIEGYLSDHLEVMDGEYTATDDKAMIFSWVVKVKVRATSPYKADDYGLDDGNSGPLFLDLYGSDGTPLAGFDGFGSDFGDDAKLKEILTRGSGETWITFAKFHTYGVEKYPDNVASFSVVSKKEEKPEDDGTEAAEAAEAAAPGDIDPVDFDRFLDDYEAYVDQYLKLYRKAKAGDVTALAEYPGVLEKATDLQQSMESSKGDMTPKQAARFSKIILKMGTAMAE